jgi:hypothetical protein
VASQCDDPKHEHLLEHPTFCSPFAVFNHLDSGGVSVALSIDKLAPLYLCKILEYIVCTSCDLAFGSAPTS